jgi:hypothetical protein
VVNGFDRRDGRGKVKGMAVVEVVGVDNEHGKIVSSEKNHRLSFSTVASRQLALNISSCYWQH